MNRWAMKTRVENLILELKSFFLYVPLNIPLSKPLQLLGSCLKSFPSDIIFYLGLYFQKGLEVAQYLGHPSHP